MPHARAHAPCPCPMAMAMPLPMPHAMTMPMCCGRIHAGSAAQPSSAALASRAQDGFWQDLVLGMVGETIDPADEICGARGECPPRPSRHAYSARPARGIATLGAARSEWRRSAAVDR